MKINHTRHHSVRLSGNVYKKKIRKNFFLYASHDCIKQTGSYVRKKHTKKEHKMSISCAFDYILYEDIFTGDTRERFAQTTCTQPIYTYLAIHQRNLTLYYSLV